MGVQKIRERCIVVVDHINIARVIGIRVN